MSGEVLNLPLDGIGRGVGAVAAASTVVEVDGEVRSQQLDRWSLGTEVPVAAGGVDRDERRPGARPLERDRGPVA
jgi:hypothetical protein